MSMDQIPAKEFMRRLSSIDGSLQDIAKSLNSLVKITNRQVPKIITRQDGSMIKMSIDYEDLLEEDDDDEML